MLLVVEGDHNDADYIISVTPITEEQLKHFAPLFKAIKNFKPYKGMTDEKAHGHPPTPWSHDNNWPRGEYGCREDLGEKTIGQLYGELGEEFDEDFVPHHEGNIHTINNIYVISGSKKTIFSTGR